MNQATSFRYPVALTIAGSDSGGGAGIQADLKTFSALGVYGASVITAVTAQNTCTVNGIQAIEPAIVQKQLEAVFEDLQVDAVKTGMLHNTEAVLRIAEAIDRYRPPYLVVDPVMVSTSGCRLIENDTIETIKSRLFGRATLITPNIDEAELLSGLPVRNPAEMERAAARLLELGCRAVLMKGGHLAGKESTDMLFAAGNEPLYLHADTVRTGNSHGTGCTLSSAIAAYLALGLGLHQAVVSAKQYISEALRQGADVKTGNGHGPVNHFFAPSPLRKIPLDTLESHA
ncbi:MAG: bifunctional hydroxymethylpyrimidine kinase/phosphomethylpyrimidine kinase [Parabacteroides sp.]|nr:bifunctional hydroxymethylpyrimidine kinase/phosphomethylpyrimidine kinase [Parabacteroides sp.]